MQNGIGDFGRLQCRPYIMDANDMGALKYRGGHGGESAGERG